MAKKQRGVVTSTTNDFVNVRYEHESFSRPTKESDLMTYVDDAGKVLLTDEEIEWLEEEGVDLDDPEKVNDALDGRGEER